jgi:hypothetical protein
MIRHVLAAAMAVCLFPLSVAAQTPLLTIDAASADVHKSPSVASPVIGRAARGRVLEVTREVGDWVKVSWPDAPDGIGYVRLSLGSLATAVAPSTSGVAGTAAAPRGMEPRSQSPMDVRTDIAAVERSGSALDQTRSQYVMPPTHIVGVGGLMTGSTIGFGATGRVWSRSRFGVQIELSRYSLTPPSTVDRVTSIQFAPSLIRSLRSRVTEYLWVRPYLGVGARLSRFTQTIGPTAESVSVSENRKSWQVFGGSELTFPNAPRFALSADLRYDSSRTPFAGYDFGGVGFSLSGHWYVK